MGENVSTYEFSCKKTSFDQQLDKSQFWRKSSLNGKIAAKTKQIYLVE